MLRTRSRKRVLAAVASLSVVAGLFALAPLQSGASSHREAPLVAADPQVDTTDVYAFVSPDRPDTVTLIGSWIPFEEPAGGPNFYPWADGVRYAFKIDNDARRPSRHHVHVGLLEPLPQPEHVPLQHRPGDVAERRRPELRPDLRPDPTIDDGGTLAHGRERRSRRPEQRRARRRCPTTTALFRRGHRELRRRRVGRGPGSPTTRSSSTSGCSTSSTGRTCPRSATTRSPGSTSTRSPCRSRSRTSRRAATPRRTRSSASGARRRAAASGSTAPTGGDRDRGPIRPGLASRNAARERGRDPGRAEGLLQRLEADAGLRPRSRWSRTPSCRTCSTRSTGPTSRTPTRTPPGIQRADLISVFLTGRRGPEHARERHAERDAPAEHVDRARAPDELLAARRARRRPRRVPERAPSVRRRDRRSRCAWSLGVLLPDHQAIAETIGDGVDANDVPFQSSFPYVALPHAGSEPGPALTQHREGRGRRPRPLPHHARRQRREERARREGVREGSRRGGDRVALLVAGGIGLLRRDRRAVRTPRPRTTSASTLPAPRGPVAGGSLDGDDRVAPGPPADVAAATRDALASARHRLRDAGARHRRPELVPEGGGRARASRPRSTARNVDRAARRSASLALGPSRLRRRASRSDARPSALNPYDADAYGVIGDALVELGRYDEAFEAFQTMVDTKPELASYARVSYARELLGDVVGAIDAMRQAFAGRRHRRPTPRGPPTSSASSSSTAATSPARAAWYERGLELDPRRSSRTPPASRRSRGRAATSTSRSTVRGRRRAVSRRSSTSRRSATCTRRSGRDDLAGRAGRGRRGDARSSTRRTA